MDVMVTARAIGLFDENGDDSYGTIERDDVLAALAELAAAHPGNQDLFDDAAMKVELARSAGSAHLDADSVFLRHRSSQEIHLRYRAEVAAVFFDLAIDLGIRLGSSVGATTTA
ncbi:MAG TPA: hypothetical protein VIT64_10510 [Ilumatobacteraceae bacterium]